MNPAQLLGWGAALFFTLGLLSYVFLGNQPLFRLSVALFVGSAAGYLAAAVLREFLIPSVRAAMAGEGSGWLPFFLGLLLLFYATRWRGPARLALGLMLGVAAATLLAGALLGTLFPQIQATWREWAAGASTLSPLQGMLVWFLLLAALSALHLGRTQGWPTLVRLPFRGLQLVGSLVITITLAVLLARVYQSALFALVDRLQFLVDLVFILIAGTG